MSRLEYLGWQQRVFSAKSYVLGPVYFTCVGVDGKLREFKRDNLVWVKEEKTCIRVCCREKVAVAGASVKKKTVKSEHPGFSYVTLADGSKMLVNRRLHRISK